MIHHLLEDIVAVVGCYRHNQEHEYASIRQASNLGLVQEVDVVLLDHLHVVNAAQAREDELENEIVPNLQNSGKHNRLHNHSQAINPVVKHHAKRCATLSSSRLLPIHLVEDAVHEETHALQEAKPSRHAAFC